MKEINNPYSERTLLLGLIIKSQMLFDKVHLIIDSSEELGFQHVLCMHHHLLPKTFTWHIADTDLELLPDRPEVDKCEVQYFTTQEKYKIIFELFFHEIK